MSEIEQQRARYYVGQLEVIDNLTGKCIDFKDMIVGETCSWCLPPRFISAQSELKDD